jgi:hypothetical protein
MTPKTGTNTQLVKLAIDESSGVDRPANLSPGWIVVKAEGTTKAAPNLGEVIDALRRQAATLGVTVADGALARIAADAVDNLENDDFDVLDYSEALTAAGKSPATTPAALASHSRPAKPGTPVGAG